MTAESRAWIDKASDRELALLLHFVIGYTTVDSGRPLHPIIDKYIERQSAMEEKCQQK